MVYINDLNYKTESNSQPQQLGDNATAGDPKPINRTVHKQKRRKIIFRIPEKIDDFSQITFYSYSILSQRQPQYCSQIAELAYQLYQKYILQ